MRSPLNLDTHSGWLIDIETVASPNFDERPPECPVDLVVIHAISLPPGQFGGKHIDRFFQNRLDTDEHPYFSSIEGLKVSAHFLIERSGLLKQFVSTKFRAWHCGESLFEGRSSCNDFSIGVELEGCDTQRFSAAQYSTLTDLLVELSDHYPGLTSERIVGHCDVAPGRKTDPGPRFDWAATLTTFTQRRHIRPAGNVNRH